ncbi:MULTISPECIES: amidase [Rhodobacterales]|jgi:amidase|uniref:amidase n=1 Tax=Rhodobacterales TaxID=204455 RepID=UPI00237EFDCD|nr:amidase [Phaeobacter gallaeciensis]MDE4100038.1 amidase [Phaeobacter gallaeciensis]MDE4108842.1 amidase [Phaeobacter gallaeciensis]MDE4113288.1 amidase [Phaeobacter gallaeciensis]MDE4117730.1 amidase [Phaeobacter gallaeciensis]MDE4122233.1 amidase [Phaeobacter gallaeciensis]
MTDYSSASDILAQLQDGSLTAAALMEHTLARIEAVNPDLNAIVGLRPAEELMEEARRADAMRAANVPLGPLHGLPMAIKDLANVKGIASTQGSPLMKDFVPTEDELFVSRLRAAGAILIGKTNTPEFGLGSHTFNPVYGATNNPFDPTRTCGGSSGGSAVALAAGIVALADGSDMMGSLRNPAGWNNVYGFRPTWGWVPSEPKGDVFLHPLATLGPMARSPEDIGLLLDVMSGPDPRQPLASGGAPVMPLPEVEKMRIGWLGDWGGAFPMEPGILELCEAAAKSFEDLGHTVEAVAPPFPADRIWEAWITLRSFAVAAGLRVFNDRREHLKDTAIWELERGLSMTAQQVQEASDARSDWQRAAARLFQDYDALILPTAQCWPFPVDIDYPREIAGVEMDTYHRWMQVVVPVSLLGLPCLGAPAGFSEAGLPMGIQIFGAQGQDQNILALGQQYHAATQWPQNAPPQG